MIPFSVMSFNIRGASYDDGINAWVHRSRINISLIKEQNPDLIGFQEFQIGNLQSYEDTLGEYAIRMGEPYNRTGRIFYNAIFWKPDFFQCKEFGSIYLSLTPDRWSKDWDAARVHTMTWGRFALLPSGLEFFFFNTHLDHLGEQARLESARCIALLGKELASRGEPVILVGDFNSLPPGLEEEEWDVETPYTCFIKAGFEDTYYSFEGDREEEETTYHGFEGKDYSTLEEQPKRMDWILIRDMKRLIKRKDLSIITTGASPVYPSDHYPVMARLAWSMPSLIKCLF